MNIQYILMLKRIFGFFIFFLLLTTQVTKVNAQEEFSTKATAIYKVNENGVTNVTHTITIENLYSNLYATSYSLALTNIKAQNPKATENGKGLVVSTKDEEDKTEITINFNEPIVGKGKTRVFEFTFDENSFATKEGVVWMISIPRLIGESSFDSYEARLLVPNSFGNLAYISPDPESRGNEGTFRYYTFNKEILEKNVLVAGFGNFQVFTFTLNYHLENPINSTSNIDIAIPPDTAFQKIYYQRLTPSPVNVSIDEDGNWIASYRLAPRERIDVTAQGTVELHAKKRYFPTPSIDAIYSNLEEREYWEVNDPYIKSLAQSLKTPKAIYDYVSSNLKYDYQRVRPNVERLGARAALENKESAICMEFTDSFVALARAAGIPAREINGYAYTENPEIQPLSLVADVLHSWPEYWDSSINAWIPIDPTWASTTGQVVDYFNKLDLRHFTFVIHGKDSQKPYPPGSYKLGTNPQKDVFVSFGQPSSTKNSKTEIVTKSLKFIPFARSTIEVEISISGPSAIYDYKTVVLFDGVEKQTDLVTILPPYAKTTSKIDVPFSFLGRNTPSRIVIISGDTSQVVPTFKNQVILYNLLVLFFIFLLLTVGLIFKFKRIWLIGVKEFIFAFPAKIFPERYGPNKNTKDSDQEK